MKLFFFYYNFTTTAIQSKHIYEDEIQAGLQLRLNLADQLDQDWTKSGISSADHPNMSDSGKIQAKKSDGPMIEAQLDRLRSVDINIDSGKTQAAWVSIQSDAVVAIIHVRIVFISSFLFYCLLLNHSFHTNPNRIN